jgi:hypothetical protein
MHDPKVPGRLAYMDFDSNSGLLLATTGMVAIVASFLK